MIVKKGIFIVIDGTDGAGKATQTDLLVEHLQREGYEVFMADFPQYGKKSAGLVENYLKGEYGSPKEVGPYIPSYFYAGDRYDGSFKIRPALAKGKIVVSNRYVSASMGHQGGKIANEKKRKKYLDWLYDLEYVKFGIPKPDINIILHVDADTSQSLVDNKGSRKYIGGKKRDIHEADRQHLQDAEQAYLYLCEKYPDFQLVECMKNGKIMSREEIHQEIWKIIQKQLENWS